MVRAHSPFDFTVRQCLAADHSITEVHHRMVLAALFDEIQLRGERGWQRQMARRADLQAGPRWMGSEDVANAFAVPWDTAGGESSHLAFPGRRLMSVSNFERLCQAFGNPPYPNPSLSEMFDEFCATVGLAPEHGIEVFDWVGDSHTEPERSNWSDYFEEGKEWWGVWCLTIWNPYQQTLSALAASASD